jgi:hypothetical protein
MNLGKTAVTDETFRELKNKGELSKKLVPGLPVLWQAVTAINRSSLGRFERYFAVFTTV